jgi:hypothetical protein
VKKKSIILIGLLMLSLVFMASAGASYSQTLSDDYCQGGITHDSVFQFTQTPKPGGDGTLTISAMGDYSYPPEEYIEVVVEGTSLGIWAPSTCDCCGTLASTTFAVTRSQLLQWSSDGKIEVTLIHNYEVNCFCSVNRNTATLEYPGAVNNSPPMQQFMKILGFGQKD